MHKNEIGNLSIIEIDETDWFIIELLKMVQKERSKRTTTPSIRKVQRTNCQF